MSQWAPARQLGGRGDYWPGHPVTLWRGANTPVRSRKQTTLFYAAFQAYSIAMALVTGVVLVPLYLRYVPADLYGAWQASGSILVWMTVLDPGFSAVVQQRVAAAHGSGDYDALSGWIATGLWIGVAVALLMLLVGFLTSFFLASWMKLPHTIDTAALTSAFRWSAIGSAAMIVAYASAAGNLGLQAIVGGSVIFVGASLLRLLLIVLMLRSGFGLLAIAIPSTVMALVFMCGSFAYLRWRLFAEQVTFAWAPTRLRALAGLLSFTSVANWATVAVNNLDLFLVARFLGPSSVNTLRFTRAAPEMSRLLVERPGVAVQPSLAHLVGAGGIDRARQVLVRMLGLAICVVLLLVSGFALFNRDFVALWVGRQFFAGTLVNALVVTWFILTVSVTVLSGLCFAAGDIRGNSIAIAARAALYLPLLWVGAHFWGLAGIVAAGVVSIVATQAWYFPRAFVRIYRVPRSARLQLLRTAIHATMAAVLSCFVFLRVERSTWLHFSLAAAGFTLLYSLLLAAFSSDVRSATAMAWRFVRRRSPRGENALRGVSQETPAAGSARALG